MRRKGGEGKGECDIQKLNKNIKQSSNYGRGGRYSDKARVVQIAWDKWEGLHETSNYERMLRSPSYVKPSNLVFSVIEPVI